jgi:thioredoxin reductase (NADPH)
MQRRVVEHPKIIVHYNAEVTDVLGENVVDGVRLRDTQTGGTSELRVQGLFVAIGHQPNTGVFRDVLEMDERGYLKLKEHTMSSVEGVFIAGDVADHRYRQAVTAAGDGCRAAIDAERWLEATHQEQEALPYGAATWGATVEA